LAPIAYSARLAGRQLILEDRPQASGTATAPGNVTPVIGLQRLSNKAQGKQKTRLLATAGSKVAKQSRAQRRKAKEKESAKKGKTSQKLKAGDYIKCVRAAPESMLLLQILTLPP
jgi:hypothetical protein